MKVIIAGSREITDIPTVMRAIHKSNIKRKYISEFVSGGARGVDRIGEQIARDNGFEPKIFKANWDKFGKRAGMLRNYDMGDYADFLIAVTFLGGTAGTSGMIKYMASLKKPVFCLYVHPVSIINGDFSQDVFDTFNYTRMYRLFRTGK